MEGEGEGKGRGDDKSLIKVVRKDLLSSYQIVFLANATTIFCLLHGEEHQPLNNNKSRNTK